MAMIVFTCRKLYQAGFTPGNNSAYTLKDVLFQISYGLTLSSMNQQHLFSCSFSSLLTLKLMELDNKSQIPFLQYVLLSATSPGTKTLSRQSMGKITLNILCQEENVMQLLIQSLEKLAKCAVACLSWNDSQKSGELTCLETNSARIRKWGEQRNWPWNIQLQTLSCSFESEIRNLESESHCNPAATSSQSHEAGICTQKSEVWILSLSKLCIRLVQN